MLFDFYHIISVKTKSGEEYNFSTSEDVIVKSESYKRFCHCACEFTSFVENGGFGVNNSTIKFSKSEIFTDQRILGGYFNDSAFTVYRVERNKVNDMIVQLNDLKTILTGTFGNITDNGETVEFELRSLKQRLLSTIVDTTKILCNKEFCGSKCKLNIADFEYECEVEEVVSIYSFKVNLQDIDNVDMIKSGSFEVIDGNFHGLVFDIKDYNVEQKLITMTSNCKVFLKNGSKIKVRLGCTKTRDNCLSLGNIKNFGGFSFIPLKSTVYEIGYN